MNKQASYPAQYEEDGFDFVYEDGSSWADRVTNLILMVAGSIHWVARALLSVVKGLWRGALYVLWIIGGADD